MRHWLQNKFSGNTNITNISINIVLNRHRKNILFRSPKNFFEKPCSLYERSVCTHLSYDGVLSGTIIRTTLRAAKNNYVDTNLRCHRTTIATVWSALIETKQLLDCVDFWVLILHHDRLISYISDILSTFFLWRRLEKNIIFFTFGSDNEGGGEFKILITVVRHI